MSSLFDTIKQKQITEIIITFLDEDELRIFRILLSNTTLHIKMNNVETKPFTSNIGSSHGNGIS